MFKTTTDEFSFLLKPSTIPGAGVGVFATHDIAKDTWLAIMPKDYTGRVVQKQNVPEVFLTFCNNLPDGTVECPEEFNHPWISWFINHAENSNAEYRGGGTENIYAKKDISEGEEIFINYNTISEPENTKEAFYKK